MSPIIQPGNWQTLQDYLDAGSSSDALHVNTTSGAVTARDIVSETMPIWAAAGSPTAPTAGTVYFRRIYLRPGVYSTLRLVKNVQGATLANSFLAIFDKTLATRYVLSADLSSSISTPAAGSVLDLPLAANISTADDYFFALLIGSAVTMPTFAVGTVQMNALFTQAPQLSGTHTSTGLTAIPSSLTPSTSGGLNLWARYS